MKAPPFAYVRATSLADAFKLWSAAGPDAKLLAGGQTLLATLAFRLSDPGTLIDISRVGELKGIAKAGSAIRVGALTTHAELGASALIHEHVPLLAEAVPLIAHPAIRNRGTIGGSLAYADPAAELPACCLALEASIIARSATAERRIPAAQFFTGLYATALGPHELIAAIECPVARPGERSTILELARRSGDYAMAGVAVRAKVAGSTLVEPSIAFFGVGGRRRTRHDGDCRQSGGAGQHRRRAGRARCRPRPARRPARQPGHETAPCTRAAGPCAATHRRRRGGARRMSSDVDIALTVNGERVARRVEARRHLIDFLRLDLGLMGSHTGCEHGVCGACTLRVDGKIVRGCLVLAASLDGASVETIEGVSDAGEIRDLQEAFIARNACQCGYCTPGMLFAASDLLKANPRPSRQEIREHLSGNYCRCTGYHAIIDAVEATARERNATARA
jgi:xanthine dehydrogenase iron-sulfur cluster and FAD-binding subunit A